MRTMILSTLLLAAPALAAEPDPDLLAQAKRQRTAGWAGISGGLVAIGAGVATMTVGRPSSEVSTEDPTVYELRSISGAALFLGGATSVIIGVDSLRKAASTREAALSVVPEPVARGAGVRLTARF